MYPTVRFNLKVSMDVDVQANQIYTELKNSGIKISNVALDILVEDIEILAEAMALKNQRYAALAIDRLMSFRGFEETSVDKWCKFGNAIHNLITTEEEGDN